MEIELSAELQAVRRTLREFVQRELEPLAEEMDRTGEFPADLNPLLARNGYLGMRLPEEYGGANLGLFAWCLVNEEFCRSHYAYIFALGDSSGLGPSAIARHGTPEQKEKYLRRIVQGSVRCGLGLTEPGAGSDAAAIQTRAVPRDGGWVINGTKHFISGGADREVIVVVAVTDPEKRARGGVTLFLVEKGTPGFAATRVERPIGPAPVRLAELHFEDCWVPNSAVVGKIGDGFKIAMERLAEGRLRLAASCLGSAERLLEMMIAHAKTRYTFGKPLAERQAIQWMIADSAVELAAARAMTYETIRQVEAGKDVGTAPSMCKVYASEMACRVADRAVQVHGGMGVIRGFPVERFYRDLRHTRIGEGSSEVQRIVISRALLRD